MALNELTNPVQRLYDVVQAARKGVKHANSPAYDVWARALLGRELTDAEGDMQYLLGRLFELRSLYFDAVALVKGMEDVNHDLFLTWVRPINYMLLVPNFWKPWNEVSQDVDDLVMQALQFAAHEAARRHQERVLATEDISALKERMISLIAQVQGSSLPQSVKDVLLRGIVEMLSALADYPTMSSAALRRGLERAVGAIAMNRELIRPHLQSDEVRETVSVMEDMREKIAFVANLAQIGQVVVEIGKWLAS